MQRAPDAGVSAGNMSSHDAIVEPAPERQDDVAVGEEMLGADALLQVLSEWGIECIFICPGSTEAAFLDASHRYSHLRVVLTTHESIAVSMADGYARTTGRAAVAYLHANVGLSNGISHLYAAQLGRSPVVVLTGIKHTTLQSRRGFTTTPFMRDYVRQHVKLAWQSVSAGDVPEDAIRALKTAVTEPCGPVWLGLPQDFLETRFTPAGLEPARFHVPGRTRPATPDVAAAAGLIRGAARPLMIVGSEVARAQAVDTAVALAEQIKATVVAEDRRTYERSSFPVDHPCFAGLYASDRDVLQNADLVVLAGARNPVQFEPAAWCHLPKDARVIQLHPDPSEIANTAPVDVPLVADVGLGLEDLLVHLSDASARPSAVRFLDSARDEYGRLRDALFTEQESAATPIKAALLMRELAYSADRNTTIVVDATTSAGWLLHAATLAPDSAVHTTSSGSLGWGMGAALGAALGDNSRRVMAVLGDGVFQFGIQSLWTAAYYKIPVVFVVVNNRSYAAVGAALRRHGGPAFRDGLRVGVDLSGPDLSAIARGFGLPSKQIDKLEDVGPAVVEAMSSRTPAMIEVLTDPEDLGP